MDKTFLPWDPEQSWLFPPSVADLLPDGHAAHLVRDIVPNELDPSGIVAAYSEVRGAPPFHPAMMTALLFEARGFRQFLLRGLARVRGEWRLASTAHNLLKIRARAMDAR